MARQAAQTLTPPSGGPYRLGGPRATGHTERLQSLARWWPSTVSPSGGVTHPTGYSRRVKADQMGADREPGVLLPFIAHSSQVIVTLLEGQSSIPPGHPHFVVCRPSCVLDANGPAALVRVNIHAAARGAVTSRCRSRQDPASRSRQARARTARRTSPRAPANAWAGRSRRRGRARAASAPDRAPLS